MVASYGFLQIFKTVKVRAVLVLPYISVVRIVGYLAPFMNPGALARITAGLVPEALFDPIDYFYVRNPTNFNFGPPLVLPIDIDAFQIDAAINSVPVATARISVGYAFSQHYPEFAVGNITYKVSLAHALEKFFSDPGMSTNLDLRAAIYAHCPTINKTPNSPITNSVTSDIEDAPYPFLGGPMLSFAAEWVCLFDGFITGASDVLSLGENESVSLSVTLTHFLDQLNFSSSLTSMTGPANKSSMSYNVYQVADPFSSLLQSSAEPGWNSSTGAGVGAMSVGSGFCSEADFWGYHVASPSISPDGTSAINRSYGLKSFLKSLCNYNIFNWMSVFMQVPESSLCPFNFLNMVNWRAAEALNRIEPISSVPGALPSSFIYEENQMVMSAKDTLRFAIQVLKMSRYPFVGLTPGITRSELIFLAGMAYYVAGYRYGMPLAMQMIYDIEKPISEASGFGYDIAFATYGDLGEKSIWELLINEYLPKYTLFLMPRASYALVAPLQPTLAYVWQYIESRDSFAIVRETKRRTPLRGVLLISPIQNESGLFAAGTNRAGMENLIGVVSGVFDSCNLGSFEVKNAPNWINYTNMIPAYFTDKTFDADQQVMHCWEDPLREFYSDASNFGNDMDNPANMFPIWWLRSLNLLARSFFSIEYTKGNNLLVTTKFRYDIAPGSIVMVELPKDKNVELNVINRSNPINSPLNTHGVGMVTKMTIEADANTNRAVTHFQVSFLRTGQQLFDTGLNLARHPIWATVVCGAPWADARWILAYLGPRGSLISL